MVSKLSNPKRYLITFAHWFGRHSKRMLPRADWMNDATLPVLQLLHEAGVPIPQGTMVEVIYHRRNGPSQSTIGRALKELRERGWISTTEHYNSLYELTDRGRAYLRGELDASEIEG